MSHIVKVVIDETVRQACHDRAMVYLNTRSRGRSFRGSDYDKAMVGEIGEYTALYCTGGVRDNGNDQDILVAGYRVESKASLMKTALVPHAGWNITMAKRDWAPTDHQDADYYAFTMVTPDMGVAYFMGVISTEDFLDKAVSREQGKTYERGFYCYQDCWAIPARALSACSRQRELA